MAADLPSCEVDLARDHSVLLEQRLAQSYFGGGARASSHGGPSSYAGLLPGCGKHHGQLNEYGSLDDGQAGQDCLQRFVSGLGRLVPAGEQLEYKPLEIEMPPPAPRAGSAAARQQQQEELERPLHGWLNLEAGRPQQAQAQAKQPQARQAQQPQPQINQPQQQAAQQQAQPQQRAEASPVPGNPLKLRLKLKGVKLASREGSADRRTPPLPAAAAVLPPPSQAQQQRLQTVLQLGADPLLSPLPSVWADVVRSPEHEPSEQLLQHPQLQPPTCQQSPTCQQAGGSPAPPPAARATTCSPPRLTPAPGSSALAGTTARPSAFESVSADAYEQMVSEGRGKQAGGAALGSTAGGDGGGSAASGAEQQQAGRAGSITGPSSAAALQQQQQQGKQRAAALPKRQRSADLEVPLARQPSLKKQHSANLAPAVAAAVAAAELAAAAAAAAAPGGIAGGAPTSVSGPAAAAAAATAAGRHFLPHVGGSSCEGGAAVAAAPGSEQQQAAAAPSTCPQQQQRRATPPPPPRQQQQPAASSGGGDGTSLGALAALLPAALQPAAGAGAVPASNTVASLQEEGKKLKKFSEKKMRDGRPTHVSSMFLCQSCVKFLTVGAVMEGRPAKFSHQNASSMYSQTASLLDSCAHNAGRAEGPPGITQAIALLATRLAAVARLRAAHCLRTEGAQQAAAFRAALEKASGETYQRPSPTDSNTSTSISVPVEAAGGAGKHAGTPSAAALGAAARGGRPSPAAAAAAGARAPGGAAAAAGGAAAATGGLVGMPQAVLERQLMAAQHSQALLAALSSFAKSSERLREYMQQAVAQNSVHGLKAAAATLLLSADAGMGPAGSVLAFAKEALDAIMQMQ